MTITRTTGPVLIVGTGLLGASVGLGLRQRGVDVLLADASPAAARLAADYGAGRILDPAILDPAILDPAGPSTPRLVVVCVPPDVAGQVIVEQLAAWPDAIVTDVTSVKDAPLAAVRAAGADLARYLGSHPMAGRETAGPLAGRANLFVGRPWVVCPHEATTPAALAAVERLALDLGAQVVTLGSAEHDRAVALVSHVPQLVSSVMAAQLLRDDTDAVALAGGGLRDVTRIAASDATLWNQILAANGPAAASILRHIAEDVRDLADALADMDAPGARRTVAEHLAAGNAGVARLPGKHGSARRAFARLTVLVDDSPGQLGRLFADIGEAEVNIEELSIEHSPGTNLGLVHLEVLPEALPRLTAELTAREWRIAE